MDSTAITVLLVEDLPADQTAVERLLRKQDRLTVSLLKAVNLSEAKQHLRKSTVDAVLLDLTLPDSSGLSTCTQLVAEFPAQPIVVVTGSDLESMGVQAVAAGAQDYLVKGSFDAELLARSLQYAIERTHSAVRLQQAELAIRHTERLASLGQMCAGIAHEINNPIAAVWGSLQAAQNHLKNGSSPERLTQCMDNMQRSLNRCSDIITSMLRFSRREPPARINQNLVSILREAVHVTTPYVLKNRASFVFEDCPDSIPVFVNRVEIEQVFVNLIRNALEANASQVKVQASVDNGTVLASVIDNGVGFAGDANEHAFDPFYTTRQDSGGTGLGLSIAHRIIEDHNGTIVISSDEESRVEIRMPLSEISGEMHGDAE